MNDRSLTLQLQALAVRRGMDFVGVAPVERFPPAQDPRRHLPEATCVVSIGMHYPDACLEAPGAGAGTHAFVVGEIRRRLRFVALDIAAMLERSGYAALPRTPLDDEVAAVAAGLGEMGLHGRCLTPEHGPRQAFTAILTEAPLVPDPLYEGPELCDGCGLCLAEPEAPPDLSEVTIGGRGFEVAPAAALISPVERERLQREVGSGVADAAVRLCLPPALRGERRRLYSWNRGVMDRWRPVRLPAHAEALTEEVITLARQGGADLVGVAPVDRLVRVPGVMPAKDILPGSTCVIVLAVHYPDAAVERAMETPAEAVGPYTFAQWESLRLLGFTAVDLCRRLERRGFAAVTDLDLFRTGGLVATPRGLVPDNWANAPVAVAAGLGELGLNGLCLTPEFGPRQRFISILTDAPVTPSAMYAGAPLCDECGLCIERCYVSALSPTHREVIDIGGREFRVAMRDLPRCDWSKRHALVGAAGPEYLGSTTDIPPPEEVTAAALDEAAARRDPIQDRHWRGVVEACLRECLPPHLRVRDEAFSSVYRRRSEAVQRNG
jgi:epoxyqueuosine reductase QueG